MLVWVSTNAKTLELAFGGDGRCRRFAGAFRGAFGLVLRHKVRVWFEFCKVGTRYLPILGLNNAYLMVGWLCIMHYAILHDFSYVSYNSEAKPYAL